LIIRKISAVRLKRIKFYCDWSWPHADPAGKLTAFPQIYLDLRAILLREGSGEDGTGMGGKEWERM